MYNWLDVAYRTELVYNRVFEMDSKVINQNEDLAKDQDDAIKRNSILFRRLIRYYTVGTFSGPAVCFFMVCLHMLNMICEFIWPKDSIEVCPDIYL
jgi:hypothetical protein